MKYFSSLMIAATFGAGLLLSPERVVAQGTAVGNLRQVGQSRFGIGNVGLVGGSRTQSSFGNGIGLSSLGASTTLNSDITSPNRTFGLQNGGLTSAGRRGVSFENPVSLIDFTMTGRQSTQLISDVLSGVQLNELRGLNPDAPRRGLSPYQQKYLGQPVDKFALAFPNTTISGMPSLRRPMIPIASSDLNEDKVATDFEQLLPVSGPIIDVLGRAQRDSRNFLAKGLDQMLIASKFRLAQFEFEAARSADPNYPMPYLGMTYTSFLLGNTQMGFVSWRHCLRRFSEGPGSLDLLKFDVEGLSSDVIRARAGIREKTRVLRTGLDSLSFETDASSANEVLRQSFLALLALQSGELDMAAGKARRATQENNRLPADKRVEGLERFADLVIEATNSGPFAK